jgi:hypothetical protein
MQFFSAIESPRKQDPDPASHIQQILNLNAMLMNARRREVLELVFHEEVWAN